MRKKENNHNDISVKDWLTLVAAVIAAIVSILNVTFNTWSQGNLERQKWAQTRQDEANKNLNLAVVDLTKKLAIGHQKIAWLIWKASNDAENFSKDDFADYSKEAKALLPEIVASKITITAMNQEMAYKLLPVAENLLQMDGDVGRAEVIYFHDQKKGLDMLLSLKERNMNHLGNLESDVANIINNKELTTY